MGLPEQDQDQDQNDIEGDISPHLQSIDGLGNRTPGRANLRLVKDNEENPVPKNTGSVAKQEDNGNVIQGPWANSVEEKKLTPKSVGRINFMMYNGKKYGPSGLIVSLFIVLLGSLSPAGLLVQMKEVLTGKFNAQLASMDVRTTKILRAKTIGGIFCDTLNKCKYSTMSTKQYNKFKNAGIDIEFEGTTWFGRQKPKTFIFENERMTASQFSSKLGTNPKLRTAVRKAYSSKFAGFVDSIWEKIAKKFTVSKAMTEVAGESDAASLRNVQKATSTENTSSNVEILDGEDHTETRRNVNPENNTRVVDPDGNQYFVGESEAGDNYVLERDITLMEDIQEGADSIAKEGSEKAGSPAAKAVAEALESGADSIPMGVFTKFVNGLKVTGILDQACVVYRAAQALGYAAKVVRAVQMARFAMLFLNVADQIKAGDANPDDVSYLGKILTTEIGGTLGLKSASDSFGYKFAAYGERGKMSTTAAQFLAGGGLPGELSIVTNAINSSLLGTPKKTCKLLGNTLVGLGSAAVGIGLSFVPIVGQVSFTAKTVASMLAEAAFQVGMMLIPELLKDIIAGKLVDKTTVGEAAGDAYASGASGILGSMAQRGGNAPLKPSEAIEYNTLSNEVASQYAEEDRLAYSPFDISNSNTFMGKIVAQLIPYVANMSSLSGILTSIASMPTRSLAMVTSNNAMAIDELANYTMCQDLDYNNLTDVKDGTGEKIQLATDPYCNVMYGIPTEYIDRDPIEVVSYLEGKLQIDPGSGAIVEGSEYQKFFTNCIARDRPLGDMGPDFQRTDGSECLFDDDPSDDDPRNPTYNSNYYLYYIDQRVLSGMDDEQMAIDPGLIPYDYAPPPPLPTREPVESGYTIPNKDKLYSDSSQASCLEGTTFAKFIEVDGVKIKLCSVPLTFFEDTGEQVLVNANVSGAWAKFVRAITYERCLPYLYVRNTPYPQIEESATSQIQHDYFLALNIDMANIESDNAGVLYHDDYYSPWLIDNAGRFDIGVGAEAWHWTPNGSEFDQ